MAASLVNLAFLLAGLSACGSADLSLPNQGTPTEMKEDRGNRQSGTIGEPLADSLVVRVLDRFGDPVGGAEITWTAEVGGSVNPSTSLTSADGRAATQRVLGTQVGTYVTTATLAGMEDAPGPVVFLTTGVAARLALTEPPSATAATGVPLSPQPVLQLQDAEGNAIAREGVVVTAQIGAGGAELAGGTSATSDGDGRVAFADLALRGATGTQQLIFAAEGFASTSATVALGVGVPAAIEAAAGKDQSAAVATKVATAPAVLVRDADGNPLEGIPVTFKVTRGGGTLSGATPVTGGDGIAAVGGWTLGQKVGANEVAASISGLDVTGSPLEFAATATPGPVDAGKSGLSAAPSSITASTGSSRSTITVTARDAFGNPIPNLAVTLAATGSGVSLTQPDGPTGGDGTATGRLSASAPGDHVVSATIAGVAVGETATVTVSIGTPNAGRTSVTVPNGTAGKGTTVEVRLRDAQGNDVPGQADAIAVSVSGANAGASVSKSDEGGGRYLATYTPRKSGSDRVEVKVSGTAVGGSPFTSTVQAADADAATSKADVPTCVEFRDLPATVSITAFDAFGNRVTRGGDNFRVTVNQGQALEPTDNGDGTYTRRLDLSIGIFRVDITLNGNRIDESPYQILVPFPFSSCRGR